MRRGNKVQSLEVRLCKLMRRRRKVLKVLAIAAGDSTVKVLVHISYFDKQQMKKRIKEALC